jgi:hypothetical protein
MPEPLVPPESINHPLPASIDRKKHPSFPAYIEIGILAATIATFIVLLYFVVPLTLGCVSAEIDDRLPHYLSPDKGLLARIFDVNHTDPYTIRTRELSYLFDFLDCSFIAYSFNRGFPHFLSLTYFLSVIALGLLHYRFSRRTAGNSFLMSLALLLLFLTTPCIFCTTVFFRTAKIGAAVSLYIVLWLLYGKVKAIADAPAVARKSGTFDRRFSTPCLLCALASCLFDEQGFFMVFSCGIMVLLFAWLYRNRNIALVCGIPLLASVVFYIVWYVMISPLLTHALLGYHTPGVLERVSLSAVFTPDFGGPGEPEKRSPASGSPRAVLTPDAMQNAFTLLIHWVGLFFGNLTVRATIALLLLSNVLLFILLQPKGKNFLDAAPALCVIITAQALVLGMVTIMVGHSPAIMLPEALPFYYCIPLTVVALFITTASLGSARTRWPKFYFVLPLILLCLVAKHVACLLTYQAVATSGHFSPQLDQNAQTGFMVKSLRAGYDKETNRYKVTGVVLDCIRSSPAWSFLLKDRLDSPKQ